MISTLATLVLGFGLASASALPPTEKAAPPPPSGALSPPPPLLGPKGAAPPPPQGPPPPPPAPYHSISSVTVIEVTPSATSAVEPSTTGTATDVTSAPTTTESSVPATCDTNLTSTATLTHDYANTIYDYVTTFLPTSTATVTVYTAIPNSTVSEYLGPFLTETSVVNNIGTTTQTLYDYVTTGVCTSTKTITAESTSTVYTGSFTPTQLTAYCPTSMSYVQVYAGDEVTSTYTYTELPRVTSTSTVSTLSTKYYYGATITETLPVSAFEYATATSTQTIEYLCTSTSYTATASTTTTTQSAKCAPTNFVTNLSSVGNLDGLDAKNLWQGESPANKDASTCCQACVEDDKCVAMDFYSGSGCSLYLGSECGKSIQVKYNFPGAQGFSAQAGCGSVVLAP